MSEDKNNPHDKSLLDQGDANQGSAEQQNQASLNNSNNQTLAAQSHRKSGLLRFFVIFLLLVASATAGGWFAFHYLNQQFAEMGQQQANALTGLSRHLESLQVENQQLLNQQENLQRALTAAVADTENQMLTLAERLNESEAKGSADWTLAEVEYLLRIANQRLITSRDRKTAVEMMQAADSVLRELAYPELAIVRRQLAADISRLTLSASVDLEGLYFELEAIAHQIGELEPYQPEALETLPYDSSNHQGFWQDFWGRILAVLSRYVIIDTQSSEPQYLLTEEQEVARLLGVQLQIRQAQLAMLSGRQELFSTSLNASADSIGNFYKGNQSGLAIVMRLRQIANTELQSEMLDIGDSIRSLSEVVNQLSRVDME